MINDESRRDHVKCPHTGPSIVYLRNNFFHGALAFKCERSVKKVFKREKQNFFVICAGGPDYHPKS